MALMQQHGEAGHVAYAFQGVEAAQRHRVVEGQLGGDGVAAVVVDGAAVHAGFDTVEVGFDGHVDTQERTLLHTIRYISQHQTNEEARGIDLIEGRFTEILSRGTNARKHTGTNETTSLLTTFKLL